MYGGDGNDTLYGGAGDDSLYGGIGADTADRRRRQRPARRRQRQRHPDRRPRRHHRRRRRRRPDPAGRRPDRHRRHQHLWRAGNRLPGFQRPAAAGDAALHHPARRAGRRQRYGDAAGRHHRHLHRHRGHHLLHPRHPHRHPARAGRGRDPQVRRPRVDAGPRPQPVRWIGRRTGSGGRAAGAGAHRPRRAWRNRRRWRFRRSTGCWSAGRWSRCCSATPRCWSPQSTWRIIPGSSGSRAGWSSTCTCCSTARDRLAEGAAAESLHPGEAAMAALDPEARDEVLALFPDLRQRADRRPDLPPGAARVRGAAVGPRDLTEAAGRSRPRPRRPDGAPAAIAGAGIRPVCGRRWVGQCSPLCQDRQHPLPDLGVVVDEVLADAPRRRRRRSAPAAAQVRAPRPRGTRRCG